MVDGPIYVRLKKQKGLVRNSYTYRDCQITIENGVSRIEIEGVKEKDSHIFSGFDGFEYRDGAPSILAIDRSDLGEGECIVVFDTDKDGELVGIEIV